MPNAKLKPRKNGATQDRDLLFQAFVDGLPKATHQWRPLGGSKTEWCGCSCQTRGKHFIDVCVVDDQICYEFRDRGVIKEGWEQRKFPVSIGGVRSALRLVKSRFVW